MDTIRLADVTIRQGERTQFLQARESSARRDEESRNQRNFTALARSFPSHLATSQLPSAHMASSVAIPQDIIDSVVEAVGNDKHLLKKCALVSSSFLRPSRKQLFSKISLSHKDSQGFHQFLVQNPVIQSFVRSIAINERRGFEFQNSTSLLAILRLPFSRLESFSITLSFWHRGAWNWNSFSCELKDALSNIIHSPTLKTLYLKGIVNVPITLFLGVHFTNLQLHSLSPNDFDGEQSSSLTPAASKGVATTTSHTVIDQCIWDLWGSTWYEISYI